MDNQTDFDENMAEVIDGLCRIGGVNSTEGKIYTIGYGNEPPDAFLARLKEAEIDAIFDVRKYEKARLRCYDAAAGRDQGIPVWLDKNGMDIAYFWIPGLGKPKEMPLECYATKVLDTGEARAELLCIRLWMQTYTEACLLCSELRAYKDGKVNCHRAYVAAALGDEWDVVHL